MKAPIFILLLLGALAVNAQTKSDTTGKANAPNASKIAYKTDTVGCWFKELRRTKYSYGWFRSVKDSTLREVWQHGYMIKGPTVGYLYSDKKTRVKNRVVDSFEQNRNATVMADVK
jgi:hypothetical protein